MDLKERFDVAFAADREAAAPVPPVAGLLVAGRRARRRRTTTLVGGVLAVALLAGGGWASLAGDHGTEPSVTAQRDDGFLRVVEGTPDPGYPLLIEDGRLVVARGTEVLERVTGLGVEGHPEAVGLRLQVPGEDSERWVVADEGGFGSSLSDDAEERIVDFRLWVESSVWTQNGSVLDRLFTTRDGELVADSPRVRVTAAAAAPDLGPGYGGAGSTTLAADVVLDGRRLFVVGQVIEPNRPQLTVFEPAAVGDDPGLGDLVRHVAGLEPS